MGKIFIFIIICSVLVLSGCAQKTPSTSQTSSQLIDNIEQIDISNWKIYKDDEYGYTFKYPQDWNIETSPGLASREFTSKDFLSIKEYRGGDFPNSVIKKGGSFTIEIKKAQGVFLKEYSFDKLEKMYGGPTNVFNTKKIMIGEDFALYRNYVQYVEDYAMLDAIFHHFKNDVLYIRISMRSAVAEKENFQNIFDQIMSTFKFY